MSRVSNFFDQGPKELWNKRWIQGNRSHWKKKDKLDSEEKHHNYVKGLSCSPKFFLNGVIGIYSLLNNKPSECLIHLIYRTTRKCRQQPAIQHNVTRWGSWVNHPLLAFFISGFLYLNQFYHGLNTQIMQVYSFVNSRFLLNFLGMIICSNTDLVLTVLA